MARDSASLIFTARSAEPVVRRALRCVRSRPADRRRRYLADTTQAHPGNIGCCPRLMTAREAHAGRHRSSVLVRSSDRHWRRALPGPSGDWCAPCCPRHSKPRVSSSATSERCEARPEEDGQQQPDEADNHQHRSDHRDVDVDKAVIKSPGENCAADNEQHAHRCAFVVHQEHSLLRQSVAGEQEASRRQAWLVTPASSPRSSSAAAYFRCSPASGACGTAGAAFCCSDPTNGFSGSARFTCSFSPMRYLRM